MSEAKKEFYRVFGQWEAATTQLQGMETLGPMEDFNGRPLWAETVAEKERLRKLIQRLEPTLARLKAAVDA